MQEIEFKGRKLLLNINADNKPNLAGGPHWTAELHAGVESRYRKVRES